MRRRGSDWGARTARAISMARVAAKYHRPDLGSPHGTHHRSADDVGATDGYDGAPERGRRLISGRDASRRSDSSLAPRRFTEDRPNRRLILLRVGRKVP